MKDILVSSSWLVLGTAMVCAQPLTIQSWNGNGQLQWNDISTPFVQATSYTIEWAARLGENPTAWNPLKVIMATNQNYAADVPMFYRVRAELEGHFPSLKLATLSDTHYFAPSLLVQDGPAFRAYLAADRKLLMQSQAILEAMISEVKQTQPQIVLVTGDLTKDGELICHQAMTNYLGQLKAGGAKVFVIPGNHDINNPHALAYDGATTSPVPSVTPAEFAALYAGFGYGDALARDPNSLSYVAEPVPGLWILAMDACHYERNTNGAPFDGGYFDTPRLNWITSQLAAARSHGKYVIGMMHAGLLEHFPGQKLLFPEYVIDDSEQVSQLFASYGLQLVFSGHFHAQDAVQADYSQGRIVDVETGSAVTFPCPYRVLDLAPSGDLTITSHSITTINYDLGGVPFPIYASNFVYSGMVDLAEYMLTSPPYSVPLATAQVLAPAMAEAFVAHYQGDEDTRGISPQTQAIMAYLQSLGDPMALFMLEALNGIFHDTPPADNDLTLSLLPKSLGWARAATPVVNRSAR
jgi:3',5'-cyclic AMP phosphodiesterase CpdA